MPQGYYSWLRSSGSGLWVFVQGYVTVFLCLRDLGRKPRHKAATRNGIPLGGMRLLA